MKSTLSFKLSLAALLLPTVLLADESTACAILLQGGVFDNRNVVTSSTNRARLQYLFCNEEASTRESAKELSISLNILSKVEGLFGQSEADYQTWRSRTCSDLRTGHESLRFSSDQSKVASKAILEAFSRCVVRNGLTQHAEIAGVGSSQFLWVFSYQPHIEGVNVAKVEPIWSSGISCTLNGKPAPASFLVGVGGKKLICKRDLCQSSVLSANAPEELSPQTISLNRVDGGEHIAPPFVLVKTQTFNMTAPISVGDLPIDSECKATKEGSWHKEKFHPGEVDQCPSLTFTDGGASSNFDNVYNDNDGSCTYRIYCRAKPSTPPSPSVCETPKSASTLPNKPSAVGLKK